MACADFKVDLASRTYNMCECGYLKDDHSAFASSAASRGRWPGLKMKTVEASLSTQKHTSQPCDNFSVDLLAVSSGYCHCGHPKSDHAAASIRSGSPKVLRASTSKASAQAAAPVKRIIPGTTKLQPTPTASVKAKPQAAGSGISLGPSSDNVESLSSPTPDVTPLKAAKPSKSGSMAYGSQELISAAFAKAKVEVEKRTSAVCACNDDSNTDDVMETSSETQNNSRFIGLSRALSPNSRPRAHSMGRRLQPLSETESEENDVAGATANNPNDTTNYVGRTESERVKMIQAELASMRATAEEEVKATKKVESEQQRMRQLEAAKLRREIRASRVEYEAASMIFWMDSEMKSARQDPGEGSDGRSSGPSSTTPNRIRRHSASGASARLSLPADLPVTSPEVPRRGRSLSFTSPQSSDSPRTPMGGIAVGQSPKFTVEKNAKMALDLLSDAIISPHQQSSTQGADTAVTDQHDEAEAQVGVSTMDESRNVARSAFSGTSLERKAFRVNNSPQALEAARKGALEIIAANQSLVSYMATERMRNKEIAEARAKSEPRSIQAQLESEQEIEEGDSENDDATNEAVSDIVDSKLINEISMSKELNDAGSNDIYAKSAVRLAADKAVHARDGDQASVNDAANDEVAEEAIVEASLRDKSPPPSNPHAAAKDPLDDWLAIEMEAKRLDREEILAQRVAQEARAKAFAEAHRARKQKNQQSTAATPASQPTVNSAPAGDLPDAKSNGPFGEAVYTEALANAQSAMQRLRTKAVHAMMDGYDAASSIDMPSNPARTLPLSTDDVAFLALSPSAQMSALQLLPTSSFALDPLLGLSAPPPRRTTSRWTDSQPSAWPPPRDRAACVLAQEVAAGKSPHLDGSAEQRKAFVAAATLEALPTAEAAALLVELRLRGDYTDVLGAMGTAGATALRAELAGGGKTKAHPWFSLTRASNKHLKSQPGLTASRLVACLSPAAVAAWLHTIAVPSAAKVLLEFHRRRAAGPVLDALTTGGLPSGAAALVCANPSSERPTLLLAMQAEPMAVLLAQLPAQDQQDVLAATEARVGELLRDSVSESGSSSSGISKSDGSLRYDEPLCASPVSPGVDDKSDSSDSAAAASATNASASGGRVRSASRGRRRERSPSKLASRMAQFVARSLSPSLTQPPSPKLPLSPGKSPTSPSVRRSGIENSLPNSSSLEVPKLSDVKAKIDERKKKEPTRLTQELVQEREEEKEGKAAATATAATTAAAAEDAHRVLVKQAEAAAAEAEAEALACEALEKEASQAADSASAEASAALEAVKVEANRLRMVADAAAQVAAAEQAVRDNAAAEKAAADKKAFEEKAAEEKAAAEKAAAEKAAAEKKTADEKAAAEKAAAEKAAAEKKAAEEKAAAEAKAAEEKAAAEAKAAEEKAAEEKAAAEKAAAEKKAAEEKAAAEKAAAEKKAAEEKAAAVAKAAEEKAAEEKAAAEMKAAEVKAAAEIKAAEEKAAAAQETARAEIRAEVVRQREAKRASIKANADAGSGRNSSDSSSSNHSNERTGSSYDTSARTAELTARVMAEAVSINAKISPEAKVTYTQEALARVSPDLAALYASASNATNNGRLSAGHPASSSAHSSPALAESLSPLSPGNPPRLWEGPRPLHQHREAPTIEVADKAATQADIPAGTAEIGDSSEDEREEANLAAAAAAAAAEEAAMNAKAEAQRAINKAEVNKRLNGVLCSSPPPLLMHRPKATVPTAAKEERTERLPGNTTPIAAAAAAAAVTRGDDPAPQFKSPADAVPSSGQQPLMVPYTPLESPPPTPYTPAMHTTLRVHSISPAVRSNLQLDTFSPLSADNETALPANAGGAPPKPLTDSPEDAAAATSSHRADGAVTASTRNSGGGVGTVSKANDMLSPLTMERERVARVKKEVSRLSGQHHIESQPPALAMLTTPEEKETVPAVQSPAIQSPAVQSPAGAGKSNTASSAASDEEVRASGQHGIASALNAFSAKSPGSDQQPVIFRPKTQWSPPQSRSPSTATESRQERARAFALRRRAEDEAAAEVAMRDAAVSNEKADHAHELAVAAGAAFNAAVLNVPQQQKTASGSGKKSPVEEVAERAAAGVAAAKQRAAEREARAAAVASAMQKAAELEESAWANAEELVCDIPSSMEGGVAPLHSTSSPPQTPSSSSLVHSSSKSVESISAATTVSTSPALVGIEYNSEGNERSNDVGNNDSPTSTTRSESSASPPLEPHGTNHRAPHPHSVTFDVSLFDWSLDSFGVPQRIVFTRATSKALGLSRRQVRMTKTPPLGLLVLRRVTLGNACISKVRAFYCLSMIV